ncbi:MAG: BlaI/MecI/CopY family transcriptional regulator [Tepidisphaeraceae bacterium]
MGAKSSDTPTSKELDVMRFAWKVKAFTTSELREHLRTRREVSINTVADAIARMVRKGYLRIADDGRPQRFAANIEPQSVGDSMIGNLLRNVFGGSVEKLQMHLARFTASPEELDKLREEFDRGRDE